MPVGSFKQPDVSPCRLRVLLAVVAQNGGLKYRVSTETVGASQVYPGTIKSPCRDRVEGRKGEIRYEKMTPRRCPVRLRRRRDQSPDTPLCYHHHLWWLRLRKKQVPSVIIIIICGG